MLLHLSRLVNSKLLVSSSLVKMSFSLPRCIFIDHCHGSQNCWNQISYIFPEITVSQPISQTACSAEENNVKITIVVKHLFFEKIFHGIHFVVSFTRLWLHVGNKVSNDSSFMSASSISFSFSSLNCNNFTSFPLFSYIQFKHLSSSCSLDGSCFIS